MQLGYFTERPYRHLDEDEILRNRHGGTMPLNVIVRAEEPGGIKDPELLRAIDRVAELLAELVDQLSVEPLSAADLERLRR